MLKTDTLITYSEIFHSLQGEGRFTGQNTAWLRLFNCNLDCKGFMQKDPTDPSTYELPYEEFDTSTVNRLEDLPVWKKGCDSSYSWAKKYKHLNHQATAEEIAYKIMDSLACEFNPTGTFRHPKSGQNTHLCFTGGEPLLPRNQRAIVSIIKAFDCIRGIDTASNLPKHITIETNGTQKLSEDFINYFMREHGDILYRGLFYSVSPKLFTVSGETNEKAIKPEIVKQYFNTGAMGQLKFVLGAETRQWDELDRTVDKFYKAGVDFPIYIMPVGALEEQQNDIAALVSDRALKRGYNVSARVHTYIYGNRIGT